MYKDNNNIKWCLSTQFLLKTKSLMSSDYKIPDQVIKEIGFDNFISYFSNLYRDCSIHYVIAPRTIEDFQMQWNIVMGTEFSFSTNQYKASILEFTKICNDLREYRQKEHAIPLIFLDLRQASIEMIEYFCVLRRITSNDPLISKSKYPAIRAVSFCVIYSSFNEIYKLMNGFPESLEYCQNLLLETSSI